MRDFQNKTLPKGLTEEEFVRLMKAIPRKDKTAKISFLLSFASGLRVSEIVGSKRIDGTDIPPLTKENILDNQINIISGKGKKDRVVPKPKLWREWMLNELPIKKTARTLERKFKKYSKIANLPDHYVFHSLRHGFGLRAIEKGIPANQVQLLMGHSSLSVTNVYTKARPTDALNKYEELF